jgi:hypothetical protein
VSPAPTQALEVRELLGFREFRADHARIPTTKQNEAREENLRPLRFLLVFFFPKAI